MTPRQSKAIFFSVIVLLYIPMTVVMVFSFNHSLRSLVWHGWTWQWYVSLWHNHELAKVTGRSLLLGVCAATSAVFVSGVAAFTLYRYRFFARRALSMLLLALIVVPDLVLAIGLMLLFRHLHIPFGFWSLWLAHTAFCVPFAVMICSNRLSDLNPNMLTAAADLGASSWQTFSWVVLPAMHSSLMVSWLLSFMLSFDDVVISYFVSGPSYTILPLHIYAMARLGANPEINALCSCLFVLTVVLVLVSQRLMRRRT